MNNFVCLGGDARTEFMLTYLLNNGYNISKIDSIQNNKSNIILPLPVSTDKKHIKGTEILISDFIKNTDKNTVIYAGKPTKEITENFHNLYDYSIREEFTQKNAVLTAQGVLKFILNNINESIKSKKIIVIGYGRCGKEICKVLKNLETEIISLSRRLLTVNDAKSNGINSDLINNYNLYTKDSDIIINTVPVKILNSKFINSVPENSILIDIASFPYGFDTDYAEKTGRIINILPSLPGKCTPKSAGIIMAQSIINIIEEGGLWKKSN